MVARPAVPEDAEAIAVIYNQGIEERTATFETRPRAAADVERWIRSRYPVTVVEEESRVIAFAAAFEYSPRECYAGVAEASLYVGRAFRRRGAGRLAMIELMHQARALGFWKLLLKIFEENGASRALFRKLGFRQIGILERHARLDGLWRNIVLAEKVLEDE